MLQSIISSFLRIGGALAIVAGIFGGLLPPPTSVSAASVDPSARFRVMLKEIKVHDDRDGILSGDGELNLTFRIWRCAEGSRAPCVDARKNNDGIPGIIGGYVREGISAGSGDTREFGVTLPQDPAGIAVYDGYQYVIHFSVDEEDYKGRNGEFLGDVFHVLDTGATGLGIGTHTARSGVGDGGHVGDYSVTYEIQPALVPDLRPSQIEVKGPLGGQKYLVCTGVQNIGLGDAGPFELVLRVDGKGSPDGRYQVTDMPSGVGRLICVAMELPASGPHTISATVDDAKRVVEYDETNNYIELKYEPTVSAASLAPVPGSAQADLVVTAIQVNGHAPDGKDDCKDGPNIVAVTLKNQGAEEAGESEVRLTIDGIDDHSVEKPLSGLEAGEERVVRFEGVRMKKGERHLTVVADTKQAVAESDEENNGRHASARCTADNR